MNSSQAAPAAATPEAVPEAVFEEVTGMLHAVLGEHGGVDDAGITMDTRFHDDLDLESIDLVTLGGHLQARYGELVNFAEYLSELGLEEIIGLTAGQLVEHIAGCLRAPGER
ncbi:acyl carrier protein [Streptomyces klenkii]|uniref:acyl carrier protein n=1 Tax=Streptomyces klenkii TaxID=1420899 RepID=UPI003438A626